MVSTTTRPVKFDARLAKLSPSVYDEAKAAYGEWNIACAGWREFWRWFEMTEAQHLSQYRAIKPTHELFCLDADPEWCEERRAMELCGRGEKLEDR